MESDSRPNYARVLSDEFVKTDWTPAKKPRSSRRSRTRSSTGNPNGESLEENEISDGSDSEDEEQGQEKVCRVVVDSSGDEFYSAEEELFSSDEDEDEETCGNLSGQTITREAPCLIARCAAGESSAYFTVPLTASVYFMREALARMLVQQ